MMGIIFSFMGKGKKKKKKKKEGDDDDDKKMQQVPRLYLVYKGEGQFCYIGCSIIAST